jgi:hypothetical protein
VQQQSNGAAHGLTIQEPAFPSVLLHVCKQNAALPSFILADIPNSIHLQRYGFLTADGLEETVAVRDEVVELLDVASGTRGLAMAFVVDAKHTEPRRGQLDPTC